MGRVVDEPVLAVFRPLPLLSATWFGGGEEVAVFAGLEQDACAERGGWNFLAIPEASGGRDDNDQRLELGRGV